MNLGPGFDLNFPSYRLVAVLKLYWIPGKSQFSIGNASSTGPFSIAILVYQSVR